MSVIMCFDSEGNTIDILTQWDVNQTVYIDWEYDCTPIFHFFNIKWDKALVIKGEIVDEYARADIPNVLLQEAYPIMGYIYLENDTSGKAIYQFQIPVRKKPKPCDYDYIENIGYISCVNLEKEMRYKLTKLIYESNELLGEYETAIAQLEDIRDDCETASENAATSESNAKISEDNSKTSEINAKTSEENSKTSEINAAKDAMLSKSYAVGGTLTRSGENSDNSKYYYNKTKSVYNSLNGTFAPQGTILFSELKTVEKEVGYVYHISEAFTTDDTFRNVGIDCPAGTNVYYTMEGLWDYMVNNEAVIVIAATEEVKEYLGI